MTIGTYPAYVRAGNLVAIDYGRWASVGIKDVADYQVQTFANGRIELIMHGYEGSAISLTHARETESDEELYKMYDKMGVVESIGGGSGGKTFTTGHMVSHDRLCVLWYGVEEEASSR